MSKTTDRNTIRIRFIDFYRGFDPDVYFLTRILSRRYDVEIRDDAHIAFVAPFGTRFLNHKGIRIYVTGENIRPDFNLHDYAISFDHLTFEDRHLRLPLYRFYESEFELACQPRKAPPGAENRDFCSYVVSNRRRSRTSTARAEVFHKLGSYRPVAAGGKQFNNIGGPVRDKLAFLAGYKFNIAFENSSTPGYVTEKLVEAKAAGSVPIYWGDPRIESEFNPAAFVNANGCANWDELLERIRALDQDSQSYRRMLEEPLFPGGLVPKRLQEQTILDFLTNIFDAQSEHAFRREQTGRWGQKTERQQRKLKFGYHWRYWTGNS